MPAVRRLASGLPYAIVSLVLVIGSLSLALAEQHAGPSAAPSATALKVPSATSTSVPVSAVEPSLTQPSGTTAVASMTGTAIVPTKTSSSALAAASATNAFPTVRVQIRASATSAHLCGPYSGWVKTYLVQPGDTLFRIAVRYSTTVDRLQHANCKTGTTIFAGELLWVPNVPAVTPALTIIPYFDTPTDSPGQPSTPPAYADTATPDATQTLDP